MSSETLRRAAALMRERAEAATPGPWEPYVLGSEGYDVRGPRPERPDIRNRQARVSRVGYNEWEVDRANAIYIAGMHPAVALAVADWLDDLHGRLTDTDCDEDDDLAAALRGEADVTDWPEVHRALAVARTYLGEA